jgi:hypothetical protein
MFMENSMMFEGCTRCGIPILHKRRTYVTPKVLDVIPYEVVMAADSVTGNLDDTEFGGDWAKEQDFFSTEEFEETDENLWE